MRRFMLFIVAVFVAGSAFAQTTPAIDQQVATAPVSAAVTPPALPAKLCGQWYTPDRRFSNTWCAIAIDVVAGTAKVEFYTGTRGKCSSLFVPVDVKYDGMTLELSVTDKEHQYGFCATTFLAVLTKNGEGYTGKIQSDFNALSATGLETTVR